MFLDTVETIKENSGFSVFGKTHLIWLAAFVITAIISCVVYRKLSPKKRNIMRIAVALLIIADEIYKTVCLLIGGRHTAAYLPFHLCSINIFLIAFHIFKKSEIVENFLYTFCIPAAIIALLTPSWTALPPSNFMHIHSFTVHILLCIYPLMLTVGGDIKPNVKTVPKCLLLLLGMAAVALCINLLFDTNFMFLMRTDDISFLVFSEKIFGHHLWVFPILLPIVIFVMQAPFIIRDKITKNLSIKTNKD